MRGPVVGRKGFYGSGALWAGTLAATMYSLFATLKLYGINPRTWLNAYLQACANNGAKPPADLSDFLGVAVENGKNRTLSTTQGPQRPKFARTDLGAGAPEVILSLIHI